MSTKLHSTNQLALSPATDDMALYRPMYTLLKTTDLCDEMFRE